MYKMVDGKRIKLSKEEIEARRLEEQQWEEEQRLNAHAVKRLEEYPPIGEQLDMIYKEGLDAWKKMIKDIKDRHPKADKGE